MKILLNKGKVIVSCISVLAILAVSLLSMFTGVSFVSSAADDATQAVTYPINGKYDADIVAGSAGITYTDIDATVKTEVTDFTGFDTTFWLTTEGDGTATKPFIIKTANQFAAVATNNLVYDATVNPSFDKSKYTIGDDNILDTASVYFKVADTVKAFNMNNTDSTVDFSGNMTAEQVEAALGSATIEIDWVGKTHFKGIFDGNGAMIYGLASKQTTGNSATGTFPLVLGATIRNLTVKNCYFYADYVGALVGTSKGEAGLTVRSCAVYNNVMISIKQHEGSFGGGAIFGNRGAYLTSFSMYDSLVCDNIVKHAKTISAHDKEYDLDLPLFPTSSNKSGAVVSNSIVIGTLPTSMTYSSDLFYNSTYTTIYSDTLGTKVSHDWLSNGEIEYILTNTFTKNADGSYTQELKTTKNGEPECKYFGDSARKHAVGSFYEIEKTAIQGSGAKDAMPDLDWSKWTVNADGYPMPKIYQPKEFSAGVAWTGEMAAFYSSGEGTAAAPYVINTAEEFVLMLTSAKAGENFALGTDIIINDTSAPNWTDTAKQWFTTNDVPAFEGALDGNGRSVSGIYYTGTQAGESAGLMPIIGSGAVIKNIVVKDSVLKGNENQNVGALVGTTADMCAKIININTAIIEDTVSFDGDATKGGVIAKVGYSSVKVEDCISKSAGLVGKVIGQANVKRSISVGAYPFAQAEYVNAQGVYTDTASDLVVENVSVLNNADMKGEVAATNMAGLNFPTSWEVQPDDYPKATGAVLSSNGVVGEVWSGSIAKDYAGGDGSPDNPFIIETAEQLAKCVTDTADAAHYKLAADIYLNDVNGNLWKDKVGCLEWFNSSQMKNVTGTKKMVFDGDGYVVHGLYLNNTAGSGYIRGGLFPQAYEGIHVKNLGMSNVYLLGSEEYDDRLGAIIGEIHNWNVTHPHIVELIKSYVGEEKWNEENLMPTHDAVATKAILEDDYVKEWIPTIENCFVDHNSYISGYRVGGLVGSCGGSIKIKDSVVTASITGRGDVGAFIGNDWSFSSIYEGSMALTQTCIVPAMGLSLSAWRNTAEFRCSQAINTYYFSTQRSSNTDFIKIANPSDRVGSAAKSFMKNLDWAGNPNDGTNDIWSVVNDGTPLQTIFKDKHTKDQFESYSNKKFTPPEVMVSFVTGTNDIVLDDIKGAMYDTMVLPQISRLGYKFTGWYVFSDLSIEYPYDYFPPRDLTLFAGWEPVGVVQDFEDYPDTIWDYDENAWQLNKPGARGGYKNAYVRNGSKSMHLLGKTGGVSDCLLNYENMLVPGTAYKMTFWVTTDKENNPATLLSLVHNSIPDYLDSAVAMENMAVATGLKVGKWVQYSYSFTAKTKWVSLRATGNSSLWFDDIVIAALDGELTNKNNVINLGTNGANGNNTTNNNTDASNGTTGDMLSPNTGTSVSIAVIISVIMSCAIIAIVSRKSLTETIVE